VVSSSAAAKKKKKKKMTTTTTALSPVLLLIGCGALLAFISIADAADAASGGGGGGHNRNWTSIVDWTTVASGGDRSRYTARFELDPFGEYDALQAEEEEEEEDPAPSRDPTNPPTDMPVEGPVTSHPTNEPTYKPTMRPSPSPITPRPTSRPSPPPIPAGTEPSPITTPRPSTLISATTSAPTSRHANFANNGGCPPDTYLFGLFKYDTNGDGWDTTTLVLHYDDVWTTKIAYKGTLRYGAEGMDYVCLPVYKCITAYTRDGLYTSEISWELRSAILGSKDAAFRPSIARGLAPEECQFSFVPDFRDDICDNTCTTWDRDVLNPLPQTKTLSPVVKPTRRPTVGPTSNPTVGPTDSPTESPEESTMSPTASPTAEPTISDDWGRRKRKRNRKLKVNGNGNAERKLRRALYGG